MRGRIGQYINFEGIKYALSALTRPVLFKPHYQVKTINEINFRNLRKNGIKYIVFDKDNTLTYAYENKFHPSIVDSIETCKSIYDYGDMVLLSNSAGSKDDQGGKEAVELEEALGIQVLHSQVILINSQIGNET